MSTGTFKNWKGNIVNKTEEWTRLTFPGISEADRSEWIRYPIGSNSKRKKNPKSITKEEKYIEIEYGCQNRVPLTVVLETPLQQC